MRSQKQRGIKMATYQMSIGVWPDECEQADAAVERLSSLIEVATTGNTVHMTDSAKADMKSMIRLLDGFVTEMKAAVKESKQKHIITSWKDKDSGMYKNTNWKRSKIDGKYATLGARFDTLDELKKHIDEVMDSRDAPEGLIKGFRI